MRAAPVPICAFLLIHCASGDPDTGPVAGSFQDTTDRVQKLKTVELVDHCVENGKEACESCRSDGRSRVSECNSICSRLGDSGCYRTCADLDNDCSSACPGDEDVCKRRGLRYWPTGASDAAILEACEAAVGRDEYCNERLVSQDCDRVSRLEKSEAVEFYRCMATRRCGDSLADCLPASLSSFGTGADGLCSRFGVSDELQRVLNRYATYMKPEVLEDLAACADPPLCLRYEHCLRAWVQLVEGGWGYL